MFGPENVISEWDVATNSEDALKKGLQYCPRIDYAIKPLNIDQNVDRNVGLINEAHEKFKPLIAQLKENGLAYNRLIGNDADPRCLIAIEFENKTPTKHRLGSLINACAIGKIGVIVTLNPKTFRSYRRIFRYLQFLQEKKKLINISNFIIIGKEEFDNVLAEFANP